jgi:5-methylcytosine-specific restriction endonuclease McrA
MFNSEQDPLSLLIELTPKLAKRRYRQSGSSNRNNLLPACQRCNSNKASMDMKPWYEQQEFYTEERMKKINDWINQEVIDIFVYTSFSSCSQPA